MTYLTVVAEALLIAGHALALPQPQVSDFHPNLAPFTSMEIDNVINNTFVIHLQCGQTLAEHAESLEFNVSATKGFFEMKWLPGYRAMLDDEMLLDVRRQPDVRLIEEDLVITLENDVASSVSKQPRTSKRDDIVEQDDATYNQRMVGSGLRLDTPVTAGRRNVLAEAGAGATIYVIDSGIRITHELFDGRARNFRDLQETPYTEPPEDMVDRFGHGTFVAGIAASVKYGTAIAADILSVKVFGGTPPEDEESDSEDEESDSEDGYSDSDDEGDEATAEEIEAHDNMLRAQAARIAMAICDVADEHEAQRDNEEYRGGVINMSFDIPTPWGAEYLEKALAYAYERGLTLVASAGNQGIQMDHYPCAYRSVICIGATDDSYERMPDFNYGPNVNLWAPGDDIKSLSNKDDDSIAGPKRGTSYAAPHVTGIAAIIVAREGLYNAWQEYESSTRERGIVSVATLRIFQNALKSVVTGLPSGSDGQPLHPNGFATTGMGAGRLLSSGAREPYLGGLHQPAAVKVNNGPSPTLPRPENAHSTAAGKA